LVRHTSVPSDLTGWPARCPQPAVHRILTSVSEYAYELHGDDPGAVERLAQAARDGELIYLTRHGQRVAAVVPADVAEQFEGDEDEQDIAAADAALAEPGESIPWEHVKAELDDIDR
jgi:antitoxin (DNA-binding transcriptional repressor) of toxin-antitoxin stability system